MKTYLPFLFAVVFLCLPSGCALSRVVKAPTATTTTGNATVTQTGNAATPAKAESDTQSAVVPIPSGSTVVFNEKLGTLAVTLSTDSTLTMTTRRDVVTGPQAFTPPAPPTPSEVADGHAVWVYRLALLIGGAAALFGLVRGWDFVMWGGGAVAGAAGVGLFVQSHPLLVGVIGGGVALAVAGVVIWHTKLKHAAPANVLPFPSA
jgi:hypothetical protein